MKELKKGDFVSYNFRENYLQIDTALEILEIQQKEYKLKHQKDARVNYEVQRLDTNEGITIRKLDDRNIFREILIEEKHLDGLNPRMRNSYNFQFEYINYSPPLTLEILLHYTEIGNLTFIKSEKRSNFSSPDLYYEKTYYSGPPSSYFESTCYYLLKNNMYKKEDVIKEFENYYLTKRSPDKNILEPISNINTLFEKLDSIKDDDKRKIALL